MATIQANKRDKEEIGKKYSKNIRNNGNVPAIIYGGKEESTAISINAVSFLKQLNNSKFKKNQIFEIKLDDSKTERVITKEISVNPLNNQFIHIDFLRVFDEKEVEVNIPISVEGISAGQRMGGVLVKPKSTVSLKCLPTNIPVEIIVDISKLKIGENIRAAEIKIDEGQSLNSNPKDILIKVESTKVSKVAESDVSAEGTTDSDQENNTESTDNENNN